MYFVSPCDARCVLFTSTLVLSLHFLLAYIPHFLLVHTISSFSSSRLPFSHEHVLFISSHFPPLLFLLSFLFTSSPFSHVHLSSHFTLLLPLALSSLLVMPSSLTLSVSLRYSFISHILYLILLSFYIYNLFYVCLPLPPLSPFLPSAVTPFKKWSRLVPKKATVWIPKLYTPESSVCLYC